jgi:heme exporter protein B
LPLPIAVPSEALLPDLLRHAWRVTQKDLVVEFRSRTAILSAATFVVLVLVVFNFGRDPTAVSAVDLAPSILWVTFTFAAILALNRAFQLELENQALDALLLAPIGRYSIYLGKLLANLIFVAAIELMGVPLFAVFFNVPVLPYAAPLAAVIALATVGFVAVGTLFSAMTVRTRFAELLLPVLLLPFMIPPLIWAVLATARLLAGRPLSEITGWLNMLAAYDIVFVALALLLFPATVNE